MKIHRILSLFMIGAVTLFFISSCKQGIMVKSIDYTVSSPSYPDGGVTEAGFTGSFTITNQGSDAGTFALSWAVYLSDNTDFDATDTAADSGVESALPVGGASETISFSGDWPSSTGAIYLLIVISSLEDIDPSNNLSVSGPVTVSAAPVADYAVGTTTLPASGQTYNPLTGSFVVDNIGNADGVVAATWSLFVSSDSILDGADPLTDSGTFTAIPMGTSSPPVDFSGNWPGTAGSVYLIIVLSATDDGDSANNEYVSSPIAVSQANRFIAVGDGGALYYSDDLGLTWTAIADPAVGTTNLTGIARDENTDRLVAVGEAGAAFFSDDGGLSWTASNTGVPDNMNAVTWGDYLGGRFISVGTNSRVIYSDTGDSGDWTTGTTPPGSSGNDISFGGGILALVHGAYSNDTTLFSADGGDTWTTSNTITGWTYWHSVTFGNSWFIAVGYDNNANESMYYESSSSTWTVATPAGVINQILRAVAYDGSNYAVAVGDIGRTWFSTDEGASWQMPTGTVPDATGWGITYGAGIWIAVGEVGSGNVWWSNDVANWIAVTAGAATLRDIVYLP